MRKAGAVCFALVIAAAISGAPPFVFVLGTAAMLSVFWFFRDPHRQIGQGWVAPADGRIIDAAELADGRTRLAIYLNILNVHVVRSPVAGTVVSIEYREGGRRLAFDKESEHNERVIWRLGTGAGEVEVVQIAGAFVRRIVPYLQVGDAVARGGRMGLIRFGSRVDVYLPAGVPIAVSIGDRTRAGVTRLDGDG